MSLNRRDWLRGLGSLAATTAFTRLEAQLEPATSGAGRNQAGTRASVPDFPRKADFRIAEGYTYISGANTHPMPIAAGEAYHRAIDRRSTIGSPAAGPVAEGTPTARLRPPDAAGQHVPDRHLRPQGRRADQSEVAGGPGECPGRPVLDAHRAIGVQRHGGHRAAAPGTFLS